MAKRSVPNEQRHFHGDMEMEIFLRSTLGDRYWGCAGYSDLRFWKKAYIELLDGVKKAFETSVGSVDLLHKNDILGAILECREAVRRRRTKDEVHRALIKYLFRIIFLLIGKHPHPVDRNRSRRTSWRLNHFRTLTYCSTAEQIESLCRYKLDIHHRDFGYDDFFDARVEYTKWREAKDLPSKTESYLQWLKERHPDLFLQVL